MPGEKNAGADAGAPAKFRQIEGEKVIAGQRVHGVQVLRPVRFFVTESCPAAGCTVQAIKELRFDLQMRSRNCVHMWS